MPPFPEAWKGGFIRRYSTTGDGLLTAVRFLSLAASRGVGVGALASMMRRFPQVLISVRVDDRDAVSTSPTVAAAVAEAERALGETGRVLLRPSGTEPLVRVLVEAETKDEADRHARLIVDVVSSVA